MKKILISVALGLALFAPKIASAAQSVVPVLNTQADTYVNATAAQNLTFVGAPIYRIEVSTGADDPILLISGQGLLYGVACSSGSAGAYGLAFDSASISGIVFGTLGKTIIPPVYSPGIIQISASSQTVVLGSNAGLNLADNPAPFNNGLVFLAHGSPLNCIIKARLVTGNNPGP